MHVIESGIGELIQPPDLDAFREWNRENKSRALVDKVMSEAEAISLRKQIDPEGFYI